MTPAPHSCGACPLHRSFCDLPEALRAAFDGLKTTVMYGKGQEIFEEGSRCHSVFALCEGNVKLVASSGEGRILLLRLVRAGEILGLAEAVLGLPYECSAIAAETSVLAVIPRETFIRFISSYPQACIVLTKALSEQYKLAQRETKFLAFGETTAVRLVRLLLEWSEELGQLLADGVYMPLHMTHADLAHAIGSTRETVTRAISSLTHDGLIERRADGVVIRRSDELTRMVGHGSSAGAGDPAIAHESLAVGGLPCSLSSSPASSLRPI